MMQQIGKSDLRSVSGNCLIRDKKIEDAARQITSIDILSPCVTSIEKDPFDLVSGLINRCCIYNENILDYGCPPVHGSSEVYNVGAGEPGDHPRNHERAKIG